ncbi:cell wall-active antibiotics response protein [Halorarius litoreus]|uniref:cell wall-active antibiotics response protein n=1 Tax=Halorarius litoreus TaxID=2962676 RepID=UPI0020CD8059|nr:cell wall-active antibiotics response protein [Halorarius litoreus]
MDYRRIPNSLLVGLAVLLVGVGLLASTTGVYDAGRLLRYAPSLFVIIGAWALVTSGFRNVFGPLLLIIGASAAQAVTLGYATWDQVFAFWPLVVIVFGVSLIAGAYKTRRGAPVSDESFMNAYAVFGGNEKRATSPSFRGADAVAAFGGVTLDLRDVKPVDPETPIRVNAVAMFGAVEIIAPRDWNVRFDVLPVLGAAEDSRLRQERTHESVDLVVDGFVAFGGVEVKD